MKYGDLISVVIPVYNRAHEIARSVGSICRQSYQNLEILVVDDCSADDIEGAVAALKDRRIRLIKRNKNGGAAAARNTGLAAATGDLVAFMDSDDISVFDRFEQEMKLLCSLPEDHIGVYCRRNRPYRYHQEGARQRRRAGAAPHLLPPIEQRSVHRHAEGQLDRHAHDAAEKISRPCRRSF